MALVAYPAETEFLPVLPVFSPFDGTIPSAAPSFSSVSFLQHRHPCLQNRRPAPEEPAVRPLPHNLHSVLSAHVRIHLLPFRIHWTLISTEYKLPLLLLFVYPHRYSASLIRFPVLERPVFQRNSTHNSLSAEFQSAFPEVLRSSMPSYSWFRLYHM